MGTATTPLTQSHWPLDEAQPVVEMTVGRLLRDAAAEAPDRTALVEGIPDASARRRWTYVELLADAERAAGMLLDRFQPGERVAIWAPNIPEWVILEMAAGLAGVVLVTVNPAYRPAELEYVLRQSGASGIFHVPEFRGNPMAASVADVQSRLPDLREVLSFADWDELFGGSAPPQTFPDVTPDHPAQIQYTSGTTGFPKGAFLHHRGIVNNARFTRERQQAPDGAVWINPMPLFHTGGCVLAALGAVCARGHACPGPGVRSGSRVGARRDRAGRPDGRGPDDADRDDGAPRLRHA